mmetsp:Transcript_15560/g.17293  ORF Transcript_15560/g.17293 Transcript_15560/m.17293 type:complete len:325 (-) Transcript_15560:261-1235(-)
MFFSLLVVHLFALVVHGSLELGEAGEDILDILMPHVQTISQLAPISEAPLRVPLDGHGLGLLVDACVQSSSHDRVDHNRLNVAGVRHLQTVLELSIAQLFRLLGHGAYGEGTQLAQHLTGVTQLRAPKQLGVGLLESEVRCNLLFHKDAKQLVHVRLLGPLQGTHGSQIHEGVQLVLCRVADRRENGAGCVRHRLGEGLCRLALKRAEILKTILIGISRLPASEARLVGVQVQLGGLRGRQLPLLDPCFDVAELSDKQSSVTRSESQRTDGGENGVSEAGVGLKDVEQSIEQLEAQRSVGFLASRKRFGQPSNAILRLGVVAKQ